MGAYCFTVIGLVFIGCGISESLLLVLAGLNARMVPTQVNIPRSGLPVSLELLYALMLEKWKPAQTQ